MYTYNESIRIDIDLSSSIVNVGY